MVDGLADGSIDVVIGTHRLLSADVKFKDLGLLVVDEEQRFGVTHKEAIKKLSTDVDVLTLTATPIPRTLEMSLTGIRDLTLLHTPPADRQPILTYVGEYDDRAVAEAIRRELLREGQVFYVHNRVATSRRWRPSCAAWFPKPGSPWPTARWTRARSRRSSSTSGRASYDVLVCTTIIESGIDMPTVNTLVVDRADRLGLGQLHQLRGRVGRAGQRAYAYLLYPAGSRPVRGGLRAAPDHRRAHRARIRVQDRHAGPGDPRRRQPARAATSPGHIAAVGYDLYVQMVSEAVAELKGEELRPPAEIKLDLPLTANLPSGYVAREDLRLEAYRRLATVTTHAEVDDIDSEWLDRYGPLPDPARALLRIGHLRAECARLGIREVAVVTGEPASAAAGSPPGWPRSS